MRRRDIGRNELILFYDTDVIFVEGNARYVEKN